MISASRWRLQVARQPSRRIRFHWIYRNQRFEAVVALGTLEDHPAGPSSIRASIVRALHFGQAGRSLAITGGWSSGLGIGT
jgi:hypothetical protein